MTRKKLISLCVFLATLPVSLIAQNENQEEQVETQSACTEILVAAQNLFDDGRIHEVPETLDINASCFTGAGLAAGEEPLNITQKSAAYRLLVLTYLQLNEKEQADRLMFELLEINPEYRIDAAIDPVEFINLYRTYKTKPVIKIALKAGGNVRTENYTNRYNTVDLARTIKYAPLSQFGLSGEFDFSEIRKKETTEKDLLLFNPELFYSSQKVIHTYNEPDFQLDHEAEYIYRSIDLRFVVHYLLTNPANQKIQIHASLGGTADMTTKVTGQVTNGGHVAGSIVETLPYNFTDQYKRFKFGAIAGSSIRMKVGLPWLVLDLRYNYYFTDPLIAENRYSHSEYIIEGNAFVLNNSLSSYLNVNVGVSIPIFNHKKLKEYSYE